MTDFLYRFRSTEYLLGEYKELEKQEIFFSHPEQLNDPMEGYKDIFWKGDEIVWKNLLKHYVLCVFHWYLTFSVSDQSGGVKRKDIPVFLKSEDLAEFCRNVYEEVLDVFFQNDKLKNYPKYLSTLHNPIRKHELLLYLNSFHLYLVSCIRLVFERKSLIHESENIHSAEINFEFMILDFETFDEFNNLLDQKHIEILHAMERVVVQQIFENEIFCAERARRSFLIDFPGEYVGSLERLIYPDWYTACFNSSYANPSMWSHYGDKHRGVCLKFKTRASSQEKPSIGLQGVNGFSMGGGNFRPVYEKIKFEFYKISYSNKYQEIDFFRSIGRLPSSALYSQWYVSESGEVSVCAAEMRANEEEWRNQYWKNFPNTVSTKLEEWRYENEHRLVLHSMTNNYFQDVENRKLKYDFSDLSGIIFGMETTLEDKLEIIRIIKEKCAKYGRKDFDFYQAFYNRNTGKIEVNLLENLLGTMDEPVLIKQ